MPDTNKIEAEISAFVSPQADAAFKAFDTKVRGMDAIASKLDSTLAKVHSATEKLATSVNRATRTMVTLARGTDNSTMAGAKASQVNTRLASTTDRVANTTNKASTATTRNTQAKEANAKATERQRKQEERLNAYLAKKRRGTVDERMSAVRGHAASVGGGAAVVSAAGGAVVGGSWAKAMEFDKLVAGIGITAGTANDQMGKIKSQLMDMSRLDATNQSISALAEGLGILVAAGEELPNAMTMLPNIGKTALASQATMQDLSATAIAFSQNLGVAAGDMDKALAMAHQAGKLGRYELKAMAQGMPAIAAGAGNIGIKGLSGVAQVTSAAQIWRQVVGNDSGTVTMAENFFAKINSPEVNSQLMKDYGINLSKIATNATARGEDAMLAVTEALLNTVGKDAEKWGEVVGDMQARTAMQALVKRKDEYIKNRDAILGKKGEEGKTAQAQRDKDAEQARNAAYAGFEQMKNSLERLVIVMGSAFAPAMGKLAWVVEKVADAVQFASNNFPGLTTVVGAGTVAIVGIAGVIVTLATVVGGATIAITLAAKAMSMLSSRARRFAEVTAFRGGTSARGGYLGGRGRGLGRGRTRGRWGAVGGFLGDMFGFGDVVDMFDMANEARQSGRARTPGAQAARRLAARRAAGGLAGRAGGVAARALPAAAGGGGLMATMGTSVGAASAGAVAGTVVAGAALGYGIAQAIEYGTEKATGQALSSHVADALTTEQSGLTRVVAGVMTMGLSEAAYAATAGLRADIKSNEDANARAKILFANSAGQLRGKGTNEDRAKAMAIWNAEIERVKAEISKHGETTELKLSLKTAEGNIRNLQNQINGVDPVNKAATQAAQKASGNAPVVNDHSSVTITIEGGPKMTTEEMARKTAEALAEVARKQKESELKLVRGAWNDGTATKG